jgi:hypothetical protein
MKARAIAQRSHLDGRRIAALVLACAAAVALCAAEPARGEELSDIPGSFADVGIGTAEMGMGGAAVAGATGASAIFWNPAGLAFTERGREFSLGYCDQMGLVPYSAASGVFRLTDDIAVGGGIIYSGDDVLSEATALVAAAGTITGIPLAGGRSIAVGATVRVRRASFGGDGSVDQEVTGSALGFGLDLGVAVPIAASTKAGFCVRDVVGALNWETSARGSYEEGVPANLTVGVAHEVLPSVSLEIDLEKALRLDRHDVILVGAELRLFEVAAVRGGFRRALEPGDLEEFSIGAGATVAAGTTSITVDAAYLIGHVENTLRIGVGFAM